MKLNYSFFKMKTREHRYFYEIQLPSGTIGRLWLRLPAAGQAGTYTVRWTRLPKTKDRESYEQCKRLIADDLTRISGLRHTVRDFHPLPYQREEACRG